MLSFFTKIPFANFQISRGIPEVSELQLNYKLNMISSNEELAIKSSEAV